VPGARWTHVDEEAVDELDPILLLQDPGLHHAVHVVDGEAVEFGFAGGHRPTEASEDRITSHGSAPDALYLSAAMTRFTFESSSAYIERPLP